MPAPVVYALAVVSTIGVALAFHHFVFEPHIGPMLEEKLEEFLARRRARRMQREGPIPVPASSIPLRRRRRRHDGQSNHSSSTLSDSDSNSGSETNDSKRVSTTSRRGTRQPSGSFAGTDFEQSFAREVSEWRTEVGRSQRSGTLRHRTNLGVHAMDELVHHAQSINPIPHPTMSPTHVIFDIDSSGPMTPSTTTVPSALSSPPAQVSPLHTATTESTLHPSPNLHHPALLRPSPLSQSSKSPANPLSPSMTTPVPDDLPSPPPFSSPIPSLSQSYPQELDRERGVELLSPPSSGTSSPFTTFSPFVAPQTLSPFAVVHPLERNPSPEVHPWSSNPDLLSSSSPSLSQHTITDADTSEYRSLPGSPTSHRSELSSPVHVAREPSYSPSPQDDFSHLSMPAASTNVTSPNALSPRSPHSDLSDLDFESDLDVISEQGSEGSDRSWAGVSAASGSSNGRH